MQENVRKHVKKAEEKRKIRRRTKILLGICCVLFVYVYMFVL